ncbi:hypothetical protein ACFQZZ_08040 [Nocardia sp. GCM10030253]
MSTKLSVSWAARLVVFLGIASTGLVVAPAQAEPLWPGGPNIPDVPALLT